MVPTTHTIRILVYISWYTGIEYIKLGTCFVSKKRILFFYKFLGKMYVKSNLYV